MKLFHLIIAGAVLVATGTTLGIVLPLTLNKNDAPQEFTTDEEHLGQDLQEQLELSYSLYESDKADGKVGSDGVALADKDKFVVYLSKIDSLTTIDINQEIYYWSMNTGYWDRLTYYHGRSIQGVSNPNTKYNNYYIYYLG